MKVRIARYGDLVSQHVAEVDLLSDKKELVETVKLRANSPEELEGKIEEQIGKWKKLPPRTEEREL